jgi:hypothetical protein
MTARPSLEHVSQTEHLFGDGLAFAAELHQLFRADDDRIEPTDLAEPLRSEDHSDVVAVGLNSHFRDVIFGQAVGVRRLSRCFLYSHLFDLPNPRRPREEES